MADLQDQNTELEEKNSSLSEELAKLRQENETQASEISNLRSRSNLSQQNWVKERDELISREAYAREEFENAKQAMQDWEALALNERSLHDSLKERMAELEEQVNSLSEAYQKATSERDTNSQAVDGLHKALQEVQNGMITKNNLLHSLLTRFIQHVKLSADNWLKTTRVSLTNFVNKSRLQKKLQNRPGQHSRPLKRILRVLFRLKRK